MAQIRGTLPSNIWKRFSSQPNRPTRGAYVSSADYATTSTQLWAAPSECVLCESPIAKERQAQFKVHCSDECERAAAVAERLAEPIAYGQYMYSSQWGSTLSLTMPGGTSLSTQSVYTGTSFASGSISATIDADIASITGASDILLGTDPSTDND